MNTDTKILNKITANRISTTSVGSSPRAGGVYPWHSGMVWHSQTKKGDSHQQTERSLPNNFDFLHLLEGVSFSNYFVFLFVQWLVWNSLAPSMLPDILLKSGNICISLQDSGLVFCFDLVLSDAAGAADGRVHIDTFWEGQKATQWVGVWSPSSQWASTETASTVWKSALGTSTQLTPSPRGRSFKSSSPEESPRTLPTEAQSQIHFAFHNSFIVWKSKLLLGFLLVWVDGLLIYFCNACLE